MLIPEFQERIEKAMDGVDGKVNGAQLTAERRAILLPLIEASVQVVKITDEESGDVKFQITVVDSDYKIRPDVTLDDLVAELDKNTNKGNVKEIPFTNNPTQEQMAAIADGTLKMSMKVIHAKVKDAIPASEFINQRCTLEDVAAGKVKVDIEA